MLSAHISSRILSVFMASYPHGKTHQEGNEADWWEKKKKKKKYFPYFLSTVHNGQSQWTNPKLLQYEQQWSSSAQIPVCLTEQQILNIIESLQRPGLQGFEIWYSWWKLHWKLGGKCFKCFKSLGWNESGFIRSPKHFHGNQLKRPWTEIKASKGITEPHQDQNLEIHFIKLISISKTYKVELKWKLWHDSMGKCHLFHTANVSKKVGERGREWEKYCIIGRRLKGSESRSKRIRCFNESDVMKGKHIFKDIHILIGVFRSSFHLLLSVFMFFH